MAGTLSISIIRSALDSVARMPARSSRAAALDIVGIAAVAIDRPKSPIGRYMMRNAKLSQEAAPSPWLVASMVLIRTLICTAARAIVPGIIRARISRSAASRGSISGRNRNPSRRRTGHWTTTWPMPPTIVPTATA